MKPRSEAKERIRGLDLRVKTIVMDQDTWKNNFHHLKIQGISGIAKYDFLIFAF